MSKGTQFWLDVWQEGDIPFHKDEVNADLISFWPRVSPDKPSKVLVPLCGKSLDMLWLVNQGYDVIGIELSEQAVLQFFNEQQLAYTVKDVAGLRCYETERLSLWVGDIFTINSSLLPLVDAIYDRAALVALPSKLRSLYVSLCLKWLKPSGSILLKTITYEYEDSLGPPYNVPHEEVKALYSNCKLTCLKTVKQSAELKTAVQRENPIFFDDHVWSITKIA